MDKKLLGKRINMARKERGCTGERLAEACSINATYLRQIETGSKVPSLPVFVSLCAALNVSPTYQRNTPLSLLCCILLSSPAPGGAVPRTLTTRSPGRPDTFSPSGPP